MLFMYAQTDKENLPQSIDVHRTKPLAMHHIATIQQQPTEQHKKKLRTEFGLHERDNPLFELPVDLYRCVHACILNTINNYVYIIIRSKSLQKHTSGVPAYHFAGSIQIPAE